MSIFELNRERLLFFTTVWWYIFLALLITNLNPLEAQNIVGFLFLTLVPGLLTLLSLRLKKIPFFASVSLTVAFSLLELMVVGLLGNTILPKFGVSHPLSQNILAIEVSILYFCLTIIAWFRLVGWKCELNQNKLFPSYKDLIFSFLPIIFVLQSIVGAFRLNNGQSGWLTWALLGEIAIYLIVLFIFAKKIGDSTVSIALYFIGTSLLLMNSLRGWYITGHDIQIEYRVFEFTKNASLWNMDFYRDPYNACLSITILPTMYFNLLKVLDPYIYKFFYQFLFALTPGISYMISRHWTDKRLSLITAFYFVAFPTFFADMSFLNRQEIAFIFYALMLWVIFNKDMMLRMRQVLFLIMGVGVILSHYSTTYTTLAIFIAVVVARPVFEWLYTLLNKKWNLFKNSSLDNPAKSVAIKINSKPLITVWMVAFLFAAGFLWTSVVTQTSKNLNIVLGETVEAMFNGFTENNRSTDALNLVSFKKPDQQEEFNDYLAKVLNPIRAKAPPGTYFSLATFDKFKFQALPDENLPLTAFGKMLQSTGVDFVLINTIFSRSLAKFMEVLAPIGVLVLLLSRKIVKSLDREMFLLMIFSLIFIFLNIVIPVLSTEYGIFRAMQQSLFVLALPIVLGSSVVGSGAMSLIKRISSFYTNLNFKNTVVKKNYKGEIFSLLTCLLFFIYGSSFVQKAVGSGPTLLFLDNSGRYYDNYLIKPLEVASVDWLSRFTKDDVNGLKVQVQTDKFSKNKLASLSSLDAYNDIFPGVVRKDSYVYLGEATVLKNRATVVYGGDQITYLYPTDFLNSNKNLVYNNGKSRIYR